MENAGRMHDNIDCRWKEDYFEGGKGTKINLFLGEFRDIKQYDGSVYVVWLTENKSSCDLSTFLLCWLIGDETRVFSGSET